MNKIINNFGPKSQIIIKLVELMKKVLKNNITIRFEYP